MKPAHQPDQATQPIQPAPETSQFQLLRERRFAPFFWTQFLGAFNDNVFKNAMLIMFTFGLLTGQQASDSTISLLNNVAQFLFILPFFLFSALAGELADHYEKSRLIRYIKLFEIGIMGLAALAFYFHSTAGLLAVLFLMGIQSAFFGPVKYSIIPQHLPRHELVGGNALIGAGTFLAILFGTLLGGLLCKLPSPGTWISATVIGLAVLGWWSSRHIPHASASNPEAVIRFNPWQGTLETLQFSRQIKSVFLSILAISWFWFLGAAYLTQLPLYARDVLYGDVGVVTLLLALFSIGIALGSLLCERLSGHKVELGLVPLGSIGLTVFGVDLFFTQGSMSPSGDLRGILAFIADPHGWRVAMDFIGIGVSGGLYIVPLYAFIQQRTPAQNRARTIAAINILNALFVVGAAAFGVVMLSVLSLSIPVFFFVLAVLNGAVAIAIYRTVPEFAMRFLVWLLSHTIYRVRHEGLHHIPEEGPAVLVCNHVSYVDALIIAGACRRPVRFVMHKPIYDLPVLNFIFRTGKAIPIHSKRVDPNTYETAFERIASELDAGEVVCIFPEGRLTSDGEIGEFRNGIEKILARNPVPVVPMALSGLWGSVFSHKGGHALTKLPRRFWSRVTLRAGEAVPAAQVSAASLATQVSTLRGNLR